MSTRTRAMIALPLVCLLALPAGAQAPAANEPVDYDAIYKIKDEGFQRSQVMDIVSYLTDVYGPRLTGSPNIKQAAEWTVKKLGEWGASNPRMENWGTFGRGWVNERFSAQVLTPTPWPIIGMPKAWTPGLSSPTTADVVYAPMESEKDFDAWKGRLKGKIVLPMPTREVKAQFEAPAKRYTDKDLQELEQIEPGAEAERRRFDPARFQFSRKRMEFLINEGVLATFEPGRGDGGTLFVQQGGAYSSAPPSGPFSMSFPAKRLTTKMDWNDLIVDEHTAKQLDEIRIWLQHGQTLYEEWGMARKLKPGYKALFHGPPGTGKTLTASLLGKLNNLDVYRIDLSMVISKYF